MFFYFLGVERVIFEREFGYNPKNVPRTLFSKFYFVLLITSIFLVLYDVVPSAKLKKTYIV